jgi:hypothetical protein
MQMALLEDAFKGNPLTGLAIGIGALLLAPMIGQVLRPAAKAVIKGGQCWRTKGSRNSARWRAIFVAEARAELGSDTETAATASPPAAPRARPRR